MIAGAALVPADRGYAMTQFTETQWSQSEASHEYRDNADSYIPDRYRVIRISQSLYEQFVMGRPGIRVMDLGCGDGIFVQHLKRCDSEFEAVLVDGSPEMLAAARRRLLDCSGLSFVQATFQELLAGPPAPGGFDLVLSSLAIHHLSRDEKAALYRWVYERLKPGGLFVNNDVVRSPTRPLEDWYLRLWHDWIAAGGAVQDKPELLDVPQRYKNNPDNHTDTLRDQLAMLEAAGFTAVDCYYKLGIFAMFGGQKPVKRGEDL